MGIDVDFLADTRWNHLQTLVQELGFDLSKTKGHLVAPSECFKALGIEFKKFPDPRPKNEPMSSGLTVLHYNTGLSTAL